MPWAGGRRLRWPQLVLLDGTDKGATSLDDSSSDALSTDHFDVLSTTSTCYPEVLGTKNINRSLSSAASTVMFQSKKPAVERIWGMGSELQNICLLNCQNTSRKRTRVSLKQSFTNW